MITSQLAADGLFPGRNVHPPVRVAQSTEDYAQAIIRELVARRVDPTPDSNGRQFVEKHFMWDRSGEKLEAILALLVASVDGRSETDRWKDDSNISFSLAGGPGK